MTLELGAEGGAWIGTGTESKRWIKPYRTRTGTNAVLEPELMLFLATADQWEEHIHLNQDLQYNEHRVDREQSHAHSLGQSITAAAEYDEQGNGR